MSLSYPTNLTDAQWELIQPLLPQAKPCGRPRSTDLRSVVNALFYVLMGGIAWRLMPHDFPKWQTVYHYFRQWLDDETLQKINHCINGNAPQVTTALFPAILIMEKGRKQV